MGAVAYAVFSGEDDPRRCARAIMGELPPTIVFSRTVSRGAIARKLQCRKVALRTRKGSTLGRFRDYANQRDKTNPQRSTLLSLPHEQRYATSSTGLSLLRDAAGCAAIRGASKKRDSVSKRRKKLWTAHLLKNIKLSEGKPLTICMPLGGSGYE